MQYQHASESIRRCIIEPIQHLIENEWFHRQCQGIHPIRIRPKHQQIPINNELQFTLNNKHQLQV